MNILIVTNIELDKKNACGNSFSNWLSDMPDYHIANIYGRSNHPVNDFCEKYFSVPLINILKNILCWHKIGNDFSNKSLQNNQTSHFENEVLKISKKKKSDILYYISELIYCSQIWQNKKYRDFLSECNPDIIFYFVTSSAFIYENLKYLRRHTNAKFVGYIADDVKGVYENGSNLLSRIYLKRLSKIINFSDILYGASKSLCDVYSKEFNRIITPLYKGCEIGEAKTSVNNPIKIVYAGNLYYGRGETLALIAKALTHINATNTLATLEIYSATELSTKLKQQLNIPGSSMTMGSREYSEIKKILSQADIVLHVESFKEEDAEIVRMSYSTKISDCIQSGAMMMVVGPANIASVEEAKTIDGAYVIDDINLIESNLRNVLNDKKNIQECALATNRFARQHFPIVKVREKLHDDFLEAIKHNL